MKEDGAGIVCFSEVYRAPGRSEASSCATRLTDASRSSHRVGMTKR